MTRLTAGTIVTGTQVLRPGWLEFADERIVATGAGTPRSADLDLGADAVVVPGFVDLHVHGGGGFAYTSPVAGDVRAAARFHLAHGTTTTLASLVTAAEPDLIHSLQVLADLVDDGVLAGVHLEGPWLSPLRPGAHQESLLRAPDLAELQRLLVAGRGAVRMVTVAPELDGALDLIGAVADAGVVAAIGHTDADLATTRAAIGAGARAGTHLFNAMRPIHHREPGPVVALLEDDRVVVEMIADGVHQHPALLDFVAGTAGPDRVALVTDAMAAAGRPDGSYRLGPLDVTVSGGVARLAGDGAIAGGSFSGGAIAGASIAGGSIAGGAIAGGTGTMDQLFRAAAGTGSEPELLAAATMSSRTPAKVLGRQDIGRLEAGSRADLVVLDQALLVRRVLRGG